ncbi:MAG: hypothetical protein J2P26_01810 [Nocardiopsaceae bacterium]|nr:hypothetical protein [Nocardiopsaceae bacterium]
MSTGISRTCHDCGAPLTTTANRCTPCQDLHQQASRDRRRNRLTQIITPRVRAELLAALRTGEPLTTATRALGVTTPALWWYAHHHPEFHQELDSALHAGRDPALAHGTATAYRYGKCRCPECRAHHNRSYGPRDSAHR